MASDTRSIQSGESMPVPESVLPPSLQKEPLFRPETQTAGDQALTSSVLPAPRGSSRLVWIGIAVAVVLVVGVGGYFLYPVLFPAPGPQPIAPPESPAPAPTVTHQSLFTAVPPQGSTEVQFDSLVASSITSALQSVAANPLPAGSVQEVAILDAAGSQVPFKNYLVSFVPTLDASQLGAWFEDDFSGFLFYNALGAWPGYVAKVKSGVPFESVMPAVAALEGADLASFYLSPPGAFAPFKDGQLNGQPSRYSAATPPAAFNYGVFGGYLIISTSYDGLKAVAPMVGI